MGEAGVRDLAIYHLHVQDDAWLKAAALYWPNIGRIVPRDYPIQESRTAEILNGELGLMVNVSPDWHGDEIGLEFLEFVERRLYDLRARFPVPPRTVRDAPFHRVPGTPARHLVEWVDLDNKGILVAEDTLVEAGLAVPAYDEHGRRWLGMHPGLAAVYLTALAQRVADDNQAQLVTDQPDNLSDWQGWTTEAIAGELLDGPTSGALRRHSADEVAAMYAVLAVQTVVPASLENVPVKKIVAARRTLHAEFDAFRAHLESLTDEFTRLAETDDPGILAARLEILANRHVRLPLADLRRGLRSVGLQPVQATMGIKSIKLPVLPAAAVAALAIPDTAAQAGLLGALILSSAVQARTTARQLRSTAAGYLLGLHRHVHPYSTVDRVLLRNRYPRLP
ncbi:DUF6236 family protein [Streptomyces aureus]|uniref:DUF6236 family protein n=1 Tax=Streptomyces aureus TaxID=193461 RepID=A0ABV4SWJ1_9ACTN